MDENELLDALKIRLGITGTYHDGLLLTIAEDVKAYMLSGGVKPRILEDVTSVGCIARGVADLWNYGAGDGKFSEVFYQRVIQLALPSAGIEDGSEEFDPIEDEEIEEIIEGESKPKKPDYEVITDEEIMDIVDVETPEYITPEDIEDVLDGTHEDTEPENPEISIGEEKYEALTDDEILELIETI